MKNLVKSVELIFENCDWVKINRGIGKIFIGDIHEEISRIAINAIRKHKVAKDIYLQISKDCEYERDNHFDTYRGINNSESLFKRIYDWNDIVQINLYFEDGSVDEYLVDFNCDEDVIGEKNSYQKTLISSEGNLYIVINKDKNIGDVFQIDSSEEYLNHIIEESILARKEIENLGYSLITSDDTILVIRDNLTMCINRDFVDVVKDNKQCLHLLFSEFYELCDYIFCVEKLELKYDANFGLHSIKVKKLDDRLKINLTHWDINVNYINNKVVFDRVEFEDKLLYNLYIIMAERFK